jgi:hypothetical protein
VGLTIDRSRGLCIRCHAKLPYRDSARAKIAGINPETHYSQAECVMCHYSHDPTRSNPKYQRAEVTP